jgi:hypothetical protein
MIKDFVSVLNPFSKKGSGGEPDPNIYYRTSKKSQISQRGPLMRPPFFMGGWLLSTYTLSSLLQDSSFFFKGSMIYCLCGTMTNVLQKVPSLLVMPIGYSLCL